VYVGCRDGKLYALNPNGSLKWSYNTEGEIGFSSPAIAVDGTVYVGSDAGGGDGTLWAFGP
jgi:outer membrane protein assembly factor BamB